jgi:hypothetical protein
MGAHARLGAGAGVTGSGGRRRSRRVQGKAPVGEDNDRAALSVSAGGNSGALRALEPQGFGKSMR